MYICLVLVLFTVGLIAELKSLPKLAKMTYPLVIFSLIGWISLTLKSSGNFHLPGISFIYWFLLGLVIFLISEISYVFKSLQFYPFMIFHSIGIIFYIISFEPIIPKERDLIPSGILLAMIVLATWSIYIKLIPNINSGDYGINKILVTVNLMLISLLLYTVFQTLFDYAWDYRPTFLVCCGALAFYFSGILAAWSEFSKSLFTNRFLVIFFFHSAQILFSAGVVLHSNNLINL